MNRSKKLIGLVEQDKDPSKDKEVTGKTWKGIRCKYCGTNLVKGKCPVNKKDCGR